MKGLINSVQKSYKKSVLKQLSLGNLTRGTRKKMHSQCQQLQNKRNCSFSHRMGRGRIRSKFQMVLSNWRHTLKSTSHSAKLCLRTAVNLEQTNAQAPNAKKWVVTAVSQWAVYECKSEMWPCSKKISLIFGFINGQRIHDNWNEICQLCCSLMEYFI